MTIFLILLLALTLRLINLDQSLWLDEATSVLVARDFSANRLLSEFSLGDFHPPLYYLLLKLWLVIFGSSEVAARSLSVAFGLGTVYLVFLLGKALNKKTGLLAALILATNPLHLYYSQEARMYVAEAFFASLVVFYFLKVAHKNSLFSMIMLALASLMLLYTDYLPIFLFIALAVFLFLFHRAKVREFILPAILTVLGYLPWLPMLFIQLESGLLVKTQLPGWWQVLGKTNLKQVALVPIKFIIGRISFYEKEIYALYAGAALASAGYIALPSLKNWRQVSIYWCWLVIPVLLSASLGLFISVFSYFRLLFVLPALCLLLAFGLSQLKGVKMAILPVFIAFSLVSQGIYLFIPRFQREDWKGAVRFIEANSQGMNAASIFVTEGQRDPYYYYSKSVPSFGPEGIKPDFDRIWLMRYAFPIFDSEDGVRLKVEQAGYRKVSEKDFNGVVVWEYVR